MRLPSADNSYRAGPPLRAIDPPPIAVTKSTQIRLSCESAVIPFAVPLVVCTAVVHSGRFDAAEIFAMKVDNLPDPNAIELLAPPAVKLAGTAPGPAITWLPSRVEASPKICGSGIHEL